MRSFGPRSLLLSFFIFVPCISATAQEDNSALLPYAVAIHQTPMQSWGPGAGIYLGNGLVLTAAHVVGHSFLTRPKVVIAGQELQSTAVKEGSFEEVDLTLLSVDQNLLPISLRLRRISLCEVKPFPGEIVATVIPQKIVRSVVISPKMLPQSAQKFDTVIRDVAETGNSGSGVFDVQKKCLLGIMSRKISEYRTSPEGTRELHDIAKYFVPAATIREFIPPESKF